MERFVRGQIVVLPFPFSDLSGSKHRPAMIIAPLTGDDVILCQITTKNRMDNYVVELTDSDFVTGSLPQVSVIRPSRLFTADSKLIVRSVGILSQKKIQQVIEKVIQIISTH